MNLLKKLIPESLKNPYRLFRAILANIYFGFPARRLKIIGITGTKGKTTTAYFIYQILKAAEFKVGLIATTGGKIQDEDFALGFHVTTPTPFELQKHLKKMVKGEIEWAVIEVTSHGLAQYRLWGLKFDIGIFTNITSDHLDYHRTWKKYFQTKAKLIRQLKSGGVVILNKDDKSFRSLEQIAQKAKRKTVSFGVQNKTADLVAIPKDYSLSQTSFLLKQKGRKTEDLVTLKMLGDFNILNALAAITTAKYLKIEDKDIYKALGSITLPPGRMEIVQKDPFLVVIDFAHNPDSLKTALENLVKLKTIPNGRIIAVFGCPGERDKARRKMGLVSAKLADVTIITADDSRTEKTEDIIEEIAGWAKKGGVKEIGGQDWREQRPKRHIYIKIPDRKRAIEFAVSIAKKNDIVGLFGMGHQRTICIGTKEFPWSEKTVTQKALALKEVKP